MDYTFEVLDHSVQPVLSIRTRTAVSELPAFLGRAYSAIIQYLQEIDVKPLEAAFTAYYNMDMEDLDVEAGFPVPHPIPGRGEIQAGEIPSGKRVSCLYKGPYSEMEPVYAAMTRWIAEQGYVPTGVSYEFYYNSPAEVAESELLTKIVFPVQQP